jgi:hypothetical protein
VYSNGLTFIPNFAKIGHLLQRLKWGHTERGDFINMRSFSLKTESRLKTNILQF